MVLKMAAGRATGHSSPISHTRSLEKVFEDAQYSGEILLCNRKLKEYPKIATKYDLTDTSGADLSKNKLLEVPAEVCDYSSLEKLNLYHNVIRALPEALVQMQALTYLNLSRNLMCNIPPFVCQLQNLEVLYANNNKLVSLPEEIGKLDRLMDLDVSCNEISHLPKQVGDLESLRSLNVRKNLLVELPVEMCRLHLVKLDFSCNKITLLPCEFRRIETIRELIFDYNPLVSPPAYVCTKGRVHVMKYLYNEALKEDRKRGFLNDVEMRRSIRKTPSQTLISEEVRSSYADVPVERRKRHTFDSGYITTDNSEKTRWSPAEVRPNNDIEEANSLAIKAAESAHEQRLSHDIIQNKRTPLRVVHSHSHSPTRTNNHVQSPVENSIGSRSQSLVGHLSIEERLADSNSPSVQPPAGQDAYTNYMPYESNNTLEDEFTRELQRQKSDYEVKKKRAEQLRLEKEEEEEREERRRTAVRLQEEQKAILDRQRTESRKHVDSSAVTNLPPSSSVSPVCVSPDVPPNNRVVQDTHSFKEQQNSSASSYRRTVSVLNYNRQPQTHSRTSANVNHMRSHRSSSVISHSSGSLAKSTGKTTNHITPEEEFKRKHEAMKSQHQHEAHMVRQQMEDRNPRLNQSFSEGEGVYSQDDTSASFESATLPRYNAGLSQKAKQALEGMREDLDKLEPGFTMRRQLQHERKEFELIEQLRQNIESRLKVTLPDDLPEALKDGVVLCHLANHLRPRSVSSIHVPSPAVPKLTMAKCRKNVENFLEACRRMGVAQRDLCPASAVLEKGGMCHLGTTVQALLNRSTYTKQSAV